MITDRYKKKMLKIKVIIFWVIMIHSSPNVNCNEDLKTELYSKKMSGDGPEARENFSPRVDYNEWMPVGRGDPLKNDPTYDYSPPVLNRVRYWTGVGDLNKYELNTNSATGVTSPVSSAIATAKSKNEILLLGVPSKRQSYRKETKYQPQNTIRRSYYVVHHNLPTRLMPPPMQTIAPMSTSSSNGKPTTTEAYQSNYNHQSSNSHSYRGNTATTPTLTSSHYENPTWGYNKYPYDTKLEESKKYISITRPDMSVASSAPSDSAMIKPIQEISVTQHTNLKRKPSWIHELLQKEITAKAPISNYISSAPTKVIHHETHFYYHHTPSSQISFTTTAYKPTEMIPMTITTERSTSAYIQPTTLPPEITTDSLFSHYKQPEKQIHGPMYLIIEGHSKVKTYGLKDNETVHMPKIRTVAMKDENSVIKHVVLKDDNGREMEVKHLHKSPTPTKSNFHLKENLIEKDSLLVEPISKSSPVAPISNLLSLIDSSFGNIFADNAIEKVHKKSIIEILRNKTESKILDDKRSSNNMIFVTTLPPLVEDHKESRQIFDYDQLTESSIFDIFGGGDYDEDENESQTETVEPNSKYLMDRNMATDEMNVNENQNITKTM